MNLIKRFLKDERGATAVEYGLICALVGVAAAGSLKLIGIALNLMFTKVGMTMGPAN